MRLTKIQIGRSVVVLVALAACLWLAYIFAAPRHFPDWILPLGRMFLAGLLMGVFLLFIRTDSRIRIAASVAILSGLFVISIPSLYLEFGVLSNWATRWIQIDSVGAWLIVLGVSGWLPSRLFKVRHIATQGWLTTWFAWTFTLTSLLILYGISVGITAWQRSLIVAYTEAGPSLALPFWEFGLTYLVIAGATLTFVHSVPRLFARRCWLWNTVLVLGLLMTSLPLIVDAEILPIWFRRIAWTVMRESDYAMHMGPFLVIAVLFGLVSRQATSARESQSTAS